VFAMAGDKKITVTYTSGKKRIDRIRCLGKILKDDFHQKKLHGEIPSWVPLRRRTVEKRKKRHGEGSEAERRDGKREALQRGCGAL